MISNWLSRLKSANRNRPSVHIVVWGLRGSGADHLADTLARIPKVTAEATEPSATKASMASTQAHLFLHRNNAFFRLQPLFDTADAAASSAMLPVDDMIDEELEGRSRLARAWQELRSQGVQPAFVSWESLYQSGNAKGSRQLLGTLLQQLGVAVDDGLVKSCFKHVAEQGRQEREREPAWWNRGRGEFEKRLWLFPPFAPDAVSASNQGPTEPVRRELLDRLIIDVGANDGADTGYYLRKGFRCVSVEAIPHLANALPAQFPAYAAAGRLVVEPFAIAATEGEVEFAINSEWTEWSSAHGAAKSIGGNTRHIRVPTVTLRTIIERHGVPYYVKIDIEGGETDAVRSLKGIDAGLLPDYLSIEVNPETPMVLQDLHDLGYREFQLVRQGGEYLPVPPSPSREGLDLPCKFSDSMSGPFGLDLPEGGWASLDAIVAQLSMFHDEMRARWARGEPSTGWHDIHARLPLTG